VDIVVDKFYGNVFTVTRYVAGGQMELSGEEVWNAVQSSLEKAVNKQSFDTWLRPLKFASLKESGLEISAPNTFVSDWVNEHYLSLIKELIKGIAGKDIAIIFKIEESVGPLFIQPPFVQPQPASAQKEPATHENLNPKYTFENFVVGENNHFAQAASQAVSETPADAYNPLFIYGNAGLGKTHLLQAIGQFIKGKTPEIKVKYISSERFTNDFIDAIAHAQMDEFRSKYRTVDVLLIDDVQFLIGKERVQEEFFHTFNDLYEAHKQVVISSDRSPKEMAPLEERLRSRFEWGLIVDIQPPDLETRVAILRKKTEVEGVEMPEDVVFYIANKVKYNIRELEGTLTKLLAYSSLMKKDVNLAMARDALKEILSINEDSEISIEEIQKKVAKAFGIKYEDMKVKKRDREIVFPRQVAMYLARELTDYSLPEIGREFGKRDHSTVIHAYNKIQEKIKIDPGLYEKIKEIKKDLEK
jgi:chromosomal replication initiator protein